MIDEEYLKLKALKEEYGVSWNEFIAYVNRVLSGGVKNGNYKQRIPRIDRR